MGLIPVDQGGEPEELPGVGDLVDAAVLSAGLVLATLGAEAVVIRMEQRLLYCPYPEKTTPWLLSSTGTLSFSFPLSQVLVPDQVALTGGAVEQVRHLAEANAVSVLAVAVPLPVPPMALEQVVSR